MRTALLGLLAACATTTTPAPPPPAPPPELDFAMLERMDRATCPYWSSQGPALVCFALHEYKGHYLTRVTQYDLAARTARTQELIGANPPDLDNPSLSDVAYEGGRLERLNQELRRRAYQPSQVVYSVAVREGAADRGRQDLGHGLTVGVEGQALTLRRGDAVLERLRWDGLRNVASVTADVVDLGGTFAVIADLRGPDPKVDTTVTVLEIWTGRARACPAHVRCAPHRERTEHYLAGICSEAFDTFELLDSLMDGVRADFAGHLLDRDDLRYLAAAHAALLGERSGEPDLDAYFFDGDANEWLPAACFGRFPSRERLTIAQLAGQENLRALDGREFLDGRH